MRKFVLLTLAVATLAACLAGCQQAEFTRQTYETVFVGMDAGELRQVLGEPTTQAGEAWTYENAQPYYRARIVMHDGRVQSKSWSVEKPNRSR